MVGFLWATDPSASTQKCMPGQPMGQLSGLMEGVSGGGCLPWAGAHFILPGRKWRKGPLDAGMEGPGLGPDPAAQLPFLVLLLQALQDAPGRALGPTGQA